MPRISAAARAGRNADDTLIIIRQDGDMLYDRKASHEVGGLIRSHALGITLPAPLAVPIYGYTTPAGPPVQRGMGYVIRTDPAIPRHSRRALNYVVPHLYEAFESESTASQKRARSQRMILMSLLLAAAMIAFLVAYVVLPLSGVGVPAKEDDSARGGGITRPLDDSARGGGRGWS